MALPNIGNPQDPPKRDGDLVNNSEGCPPPGDKEWRVKDIKLNRYPLGQGVVPISPHNGFHDLDVDLNNPMFQTEPVKDNDYAAKVLEAGTEVAQEIASDLMSGDTQTVKDITRAGDNVATAAYAVAQNEEIREGLDNLENVAEEGVENFGNGVVASIGGEVGADFNFLKDNAIVEGTLEYTQNVWLAQINSEEVAGITCEEVFLRGSLKFYGEVPLDGRARGDVLGGAEVGITMGGPFGSTVTATVGVGATVSGEISTTTTLEVSLGGR